MPDDWNSRLDELKERIDDAIALNKVEVEAFEDNQQRHAASDSQRHKGFLQLDSLRNGSQGRRLTEWDYDIKDYERWSDKLGSKKLGRVDDFSQIAEDSYYKFLRDAKIVGPKALDPASRPAASSEQSIDRVVEAVEVGDERRKRRKEGTHGSTIYINEKNKQFNEKLDREAR